jgi:hypothetical protein
MKPYRLQNCAQKPTNPNGSSSRQALQVERALYKMIILDQSEMNLRAKEQSYREDMLKA